MNASLGARAWKRSRLRAGSSRIAAHASDLFTGRPLDEGLEVSGRGRLQGRWRLFRHDAGRTAGPSALVYVVLYAAALAVGYWTISRFGTATVWLANGVATAALLQL